MISPVSSTSVVSTHAIQYQSQQPRSSGDATPAPTQDTVHLSPQAVAAAKGGDVDHDGDSR
jgi:hypothetical protein